MNPCSAHPSTPWAPGLPPLPRGRWVHAFLAYFSILRMAERSGWEVEPLRVAELPRMEGLSQRKAQTVQGQSPSVHDPENNTLSGRNRPQSHEVSDCTYMKYTTGRSIEPEGGLGLSGAGEQGTGVTV